jgi:hypothetical protein
MDRVRFGRALGSGARAAAKTLWQAADAAAAPDPRADARPGAPEARRTPVADPAAALRQAAAHVGHVQSMARRAGVEAPRAAARGVLQPVKRYASVVMLQVAGSFFALFAATLGGAAWRLHGLLNGSAADVDLRHRMYFEAAIALVFAYFAGSSFVRARERQRQS